MLQQQAVAFVCVSNSPIGLMTFHCRGSLSLHSLASSCKPVIFLPSLPWKHIRFCYKWMKKFQNGCLSPFSIPAKKFSLAKSHSVNIWEATYSCRNLIGLLGFSATKDTQEIRTATLKHFGPLCLYCMLPYGTQISLLLKELCCALQDFC